MPNNLLFRQRSALLAVVIVMNETFRSVQRIPGPFIPFTISSEVRAILSPESESNDGHDYRSCVCRRGAFGEEHHESRC